MLPTDATSSPASVLQSLFALFLNDPTKTLTLLTRIGEYVQSRFQHEGLYEVLEQDVRLELCDTAGERAVYFKHQKVRFLQNNVIAFQDQAWGDGDIFAEYKCSPGVPVDRYREGHRYRILISLRQSKQKGDIEEFYIERTIKRGFLRATEELQTEIDHKTQRMTVMLIFPKARWSKHVFLVEQHTARTTSLDSESIQVLPDGRQQVQWQMDYPKRYEAYILRWEW